MNPGSPSPCQVGWNEVVDSPAGPIPANPPKAIAWRCEWINARRESAMLMLMPRPKTADELDVTVHLLTREGARLTEEGIRRFNEEEKRKGHHVGTHFDSRLGKLYPLGPAPSGKTADFSAGQMLVVSGVQGSAVIQFSNLTRTSANYRWRFRDLIGRETSGSSNLAEPPQLTDENAGGSEVNITGFPMTVEAGQFRFRWQVTGWFEDENGSGDPFPSTHSLFYNPSENRIQVKPDSNFAAFDLASVPLFGE